MRTDHYQYILEALIGAKHLIELAVKPSPHAGATVSRLEDAIALLREEREAGLSGFGDAPEPPPAEANMGYPGYSHSDGVGEYPPRTRANSPIFAEDKPISEDEADPSKWPQSERDRIEKILNDALAVPEGHTIRIFRIV